MKTAAAPGFPGKLASTMLLSNPGSVPSASVAAARPSGSVVIVRFGLLANDPPPCRTVNVTGTPPSRLNPASVTTVTNGNASFSASAPVWLFPESTAMRAALAGTPLAVNAAVPTNPAADASTRLLPAPAREPRRSVTSARPDALVATATDDAVDPPPVTRPLLSVTRKTTTVFGTGCPAPSTSATISGAGTRLETGPCWLLPEINRIAGSVGGTRVTCTLVVAEFPERSRPTA